MAVFRHLLPFQANQTSFIQQNRSDIPKLKLAPSLL
jgi:hypothetical protein